MTATNSLLTDAADLSNWLPSRDLPRVYQQFSPAQIKTLLWKRDEHAGLSRCCRMVGARLYVNTKLFGLWMAGELPEQKQAADD